MFCLGKRKRGHLLSQSISFKKGITIDVLDEFRMKITYISVFEWGEKIERYTPAFTLFCLLLFLYSTWLLSYSIIFCSHVFLKHICCKICSKTIDLEMYLVIGWEILKQYWAMNGIFSFSSKWLGIVMTTDEILMLIERSNYHGFACTQAIFLEFLYNLHHFYNYEEGFTIYNWKNKNKRKKCCSLKWLSIIK